MTEAAPTHTAPSAELDADLINYEADDFDTLPAMGLPSDAKAGTKDASGSTDQDAYGATAANGPTTTDVDINEIDWEDHENAGMSADIGEGDALAGLDASAPLDASAGLGTSLDIGINGSITEVPNTADAAALSTAADAVDLSQDLDVDFGDSLNTNDMNSGAAHEAPEHEITYDEDELHVVEPTGDPEEDLIDYESYPDDPAEQGHPNQEHEAEHETNDGHGNTEEQGADTAEAAEYSDNQSPEDEASPDASEECLDITVSYQNEEFPLLHGQKGFSGQNGFFGDQTVLDYTMDQLLGKFRQEIVDDLGSQDEVVLQIDEMGLEYAESTHRDHVTGATLRQLHEIFEQLAKNQDPDANRTLYTNLLIRPHPAKRLEFLIEEAFNGRGLDDVSHSFQATHDGHLAAGHDGDVDMYGESSEGDEGEGSAEYDEEQAVDEDQEQDDESTSHGAETDENADNDRTSTNYAQEYEAEDDGAGLGDENLEAENEVAEFNDEAHVDDYEQHEFDDNGAGFNAMNQPQHEGGTADDAYAHTNFESEQMHADEGEGDENAGFDLLDLIDEDAGAPGPEQTDRVNTSATVTLDGDGENEINYEDDADTNHAMPAMDTNAGTVVNETHAVDTLDEIDWREPGEEDGGLKEPAAESTKRPHSEVDVDLSLDDENDVKRRRS